MENSQRRHDITDEAWALLEPLLPGQSGQWGGVAKDNRLFINFSRCGVFACRAALVAFLGLILAFSLAPELFLAGGAE